MTTQTLDQAKTEAFAGQMIGMLNGALTTLMVSVGHRTALFDRMAAMPPSTSEQIAAATELNERYVREWLGNMTTARVVEHDGAKGTYWLPGEHAGHRGGQHARGEHGPPDGTGVLRDLDLPLHDGIAGTGR